jgi:hypothetical protein
VTLCGMFTIIYLLAACFVLSENVRFTVV